MIASIEDPVVIKQILDHLQKRAAPAEPVFHPVRAPPSHPELGLEYGRRDRLDLTTQRDDYTALLNFYYIFGREP